MNRTELATRSITGIFIGVITLGAVIWSPWSYLAWLCCIVLIGAHEYLRLEKIPAVAVQRIIFPQALALITGFTGYFFLHHMESIAILAMLPLLAGTLVFLQLFFIKDPVELARLNTATYSAAAYIGIPAISGCLFLMGQYDWHYVVIPILLIWMNDIGAYLIGSQWGKHKIAPLISPGKTVEGTMGGGVMALVTTLVLILIWPEIPGAYIALLGISIPFLSLAGDLWESALKRRAGVKDSGRLLPGHGGILDRYDSLLFVLPLAVFAYYIFVV